jgi:hypothetical protein
MSASSEVVAGRFWRCCNSASRAARAACRSDEMHDCALCLMRLCIIFNPTWWHGWCQGKGIDPTATQMIAQRAKSLPLDFDKNAESCYENSDVAKLAICQRSNGYASCVSPPSCQWFDLVVAAIDLLRRAFLETFEMRLPSQSH